MRQIKFRAWDKQSKYWIEECNVVLCPDGEILVRPDPDDIDWDSGGPIDIVFFIGLHDKNGKEIYEGDIVKAIDDWGKLDQVAEVVCLYSTSWRWGVYRSIEIALKYYKNTEVIGNIYEHKELLEEPK